MVWTCVRLLSSKRRLKGQIGQILGRGGSEHGEHFSKPHCTGDAPLPLLGCGDYRPELQSMLQTWLIAGLGDLGEQAKPACVDTPGGRAPRMALALASRSGPGARSLGAAAQSCWLLAEDCRGELGGRPPGPHLWPLPSLLRRQRRLPWGRRLMGQVESSAFKPARANQRPARRPIQTRGRPAAPASGTLARGGGG